MEWYQDSTSSSILLIHHSRQESNRLCTAEKHSLFHSQLQALPIAEAKERSKLASYTTSLSDSRCWAFLAWKTNAGGYNFSIPLCNLLHCAKRRFRKATRLIGRGKKRQNLYR
ncbi:hypothetical protein C2S51_008538 [Perilla frutescens var. frutescens]|nr:hypothetical protein C2S51_008538 [Perilla frutescens var. frutescens]